MSIQKDRWNNFAGKVADHIEDYVVPQYGDEPVDLVSGYTAEECVKQCEKYANRFSRNSRPAERRRDLLKIAHYAQRAYDKMGDDA